MFKLTRLVPIIGLLIYSSLIHAQTAIINAPPAPPPPASLQDYDSQLRQSSQLPPTVAPPLVQPNTTTVIQQGPGPQNPSIITPVPNERPAVIITPPSNTGSSTSVFTPMVPNNVPLTPNYAPSNNEAGAPATPGNTWLAPNPWQTQQANPWATPSTVRPGVPVGPSTQPQQVITNIYSPSGQSPPPPPVLYR